MQNYSPDITEIVIDISLMARGLSGLLHESNQF
jgi:hypothetical protein